MADAFDVRGTADWIRELGLRKVALQLPVMPECSLSVRRGATDRPRADRMVPIFCPCLTPSCRAGTPRAQDDMLPRAALLVQLMRQELSAAAEATAATTTAAMGAPELFVLADSSVSAWDPDVISAQHVGADGLVMYGRASVCKTSAFPVRHVFGREALRADVLAAEVSRCVPADQR